jgi:CheY-like chemotaxis protein
LIKILIVDDDPSTRFVARLILERENFEIIEAAHGEAALEVAGLDPLPDVVMTDLMMPIMGGLELIRRLRADPRTAAIPIVVVSSNPDAARSLRSSGLVASIIAKPYSASELADGIRLATTEPMNPASMEGRA